MLCACASGSPKALFHWHWLQEHQCGQTLTPIEFSDFFFLYNYEASYSSLTFGLYIKHSISNLEILGWQLSNMRCMTLGSLRHLMHIGFVEHFLSYTCS